MMGAIKMSASFAASVSAPEQVVLAPEMERRGRLELQGVGQTPWSRFVAVAAAISPASSAEGVDDFPRALVCCASSPSERPL